MPDVEQNNNALKRFFNNLTEKEKKQFLGEVFSKDNLKKVIRIREVSNCPYCSSTHFVKNGTKCDNQRYLCRECNKSFVGQVGTILYNSQKDIEVWELYIHCMIKGFSLRKCAETCGINLGTSFTWRHKILDALKDAMTNITSNKPL